MVFNEPSDDELSWAGIDVEPNDLSASDFFEAQTQNDNTRRVRFNVPYDDDDDGSSTDSTEDDHAGMYPDIFVDQSTLDPSFRRQIENELDDSSASDSFWDHTALYNGYFENDSELDFGDSLDAAAAVTSTLNSRQATPVPDPQPIEGIEDFKELDGYESRFYDTLQMMLSYADQSTQARVKLLRRKNILTLPFVERLSVFQYQKRLMMKIRILIPMVALPLDGRRISPVSLVLISAD